MNEQNKEFLNKIYQNAAMGCKSISYVCEKTDDPALKDSLLKQHRQYNKVAGDASMLLNKSGSAPKDKGAVSNLALWGGIQMNTAADRSSDHIAEMMMQGSMMGVIDMSKNLRKYASSDSEVKKLGEELIKVEEANIQRMKEFL